MPSWGRFLESIGLRKKPNMPDQTKPTNIVQHRYETVDVLEKCLEKFGYKREDWKISDKNRPGLELQLPDGKKLTQEQVQEVHDAYMAEHKKRIDNDEDEDE